MASPFTILDSRPLPHESFDQPAALERRLRATVRGEVRFDPGTRALYTTDASNYRQVPIAVVLPLDTQDVEATIAACREHDAPILSRGAGTSLAGQTCNVAVILDFSRHLNAIETLDPAGNQAIVQPGVVLDHLRDAAERHALTFAPDPATHSRCTLGGMIGNNSCGVHALMGGKTVDNIDALDILLYDGTRMTVGPTPPAELEAIIQAGGRKGEIYAGLKRLRDQYATLVRARFPDIPRRVSGFNLDQLLPENGFHVARALVGSEGTCVTILSATCRLTRSPQFRRLVALGFKDAFLAADHVPEVLKHDPIGLEGFDSLLVEYMTRKNLAVDDVSLLPPGGGFLLCEFGGDSQADVDRQAHAFTAAAAQFAQQPTIAAYTAAEAARVWHVRESALGATVFVPGEASGWEGWEDSAVPPAQLGAYLRELFATIHRFGYKTPMYGHFGQGCVHLRITFELKTQAGLEAYRQFLEEASDIVLKYGGSFSGEHGDGQARAALLPKMFGPELMQAFRDFKALWDPINRMNPGKLIDPVRVYDPVENLRIGPGYQPLQIPNRFFHFPNDQGSFAAATERCVGVGACRKTDHGTMCPSYMATREEKHSTRGRAHLLWELMQGGLLTGGQPGGQPGGDQPKSIWQNEAVHEALDLCLSCKACKTECPVNVDMATWKAEFLARRYADRLHPLHHYAFGHMDKWARLASFNPTLANLTTSIPGGKKLLGIASRRTLPRFAAQPFRETFRPARYPSHVAAQAAQPTHHIHFRPFPPEDNPVLLWADTWNNYFHPEALTAAARLLTQSGHHVTIPRKHICCGRPLYDFGFLDEARKYLHRILDTFASEINAGLPVVMLEPSCASVFTDELLNFFPSNPLAERLARQTVLLSEQLTRHPGAWCPPNLTGTDIVVQGHCHQKAANKMADELALLRMTGANVTLLDSGCCGMAGPFGFEAGKFEVSQTLANRVLLPAVRAAAPATLLVSNGFSCREQIAQNSPRRALHTAEVLARPSS